MNNDDELEIFYNQNKQSKVEVVSKKNNPKETKSSKTNTINEKNLNSNHIDKNQQQQQSKTIPMISMKAFIFNFKKFYKEKTKIRNLISENSAKQRNISLCIYLRNYFNSYKNIKTMLLQTKIQEVKMLQRFEELAFRNIAEQEDTRIYVKNQETDQIAAMCRESLQELFLQKESAFYEKRVICRYLGTLLSNENYTPVGYPDLINKYKDQQALNSIYLQTVGNFIKKFSTQIKGNYFKLVDIAHFLYEQKYRRSDVEQIMKFIQKTKEIYNISQNKDKSAQIDGDRLLPFELITNAFNILSNKDKTNFDLIKELLNNIRFLINDQIKIDTVERVQKVMEHNIIGDYIYRYFSDLDEQISSLLTYIDQISQLLCSIESLNLSTKQDQLEVLLCFIHKIQGNQIEEKTAIMAQKHSTILSDLLNQFEQTVEDSKVNKDKKQKQPAPQFQMPNVKQVLYEDDLRDEQILQSNIANPYKLSTSDLPIRKPKVINLNQIKPQVNQVPVNELQEAEEFVNGYIEKDYDKDELILSQIQSQKQKNYDKKENTQFDSIQRDLLYEREFDKLKESSNAKSKDEMILTLKSQIKNLKDQVQQYQK
ncbi:unnamed protein product [Paramecium pentaurelia]|uniref:Uncharacterized protein n=1 Tax=Paramecium pentaurelia TaxID=43138 RepID=A0A8S1URE2_9CILI|nr:unnamed protein product [Paramecium pentaurelia]